MHGSPGEVGVDEGLEARGQRSQVHVPQLPRGHAPEQVEVRHALVPGPRLAHQLLPHRLALARARREAYDRSRPRRACESGETRNKWENHHILGWSGPARGGARARVESDDVPCRHAPKSAARRALMSDPIGVSRRA